MSVPDNDANMTGYTTHAGNHGGSGYPLMRGLVLPCGGTMIIDAVFGATSVGEPPTPTTCSLRCAPA